MHSKHMMAEGHEGVIWVLASWLNDDEFGDSRVSQLSIVDATDLYYEIP